MDLPKLISSLVILLFGFVTLNVGQTTSQPVLPKIAVLDFEAIGGSIDTTLGRGVAEILLSALTKSEKYQVVERQQLAKVLKEQKLQMTDLIDPKSAVEIGKILGVETIVAGSIVKMGRTYTITPRFIEVKTATVKKSENLT
ncbi:MAG: CsgG/HfaB family protein, partial [bacterium]|nr:CsgG/HfaB family protein [bacterium]